MESKGCVDELFLFNRFIDVSAAGATAACARARAARAPCAPPPAASRVAPRQAIFIIDGILQFFLMYPQTPKARAAPPVAARAAPSRRAMPALRARERERARMSTSRACAPRGPAHPLGGRAPRARAARAAAAH